MLEGHAAYVRITMILFAIFLLGGTHSSYAGQSTIVVAEGYSCMGVDKSRRDTEKEAKADARRNAVENAQMLIKSQTKVKDFQVEKDLIEAYAQAQVTVIAELKEGTGWRHDESMGDCYRYRMQAEVVPDEKTMSQISGRTDMADDPAAPLNVRIWTDKKEYRQGDLVRIYLKGNRPFFAQVLYRDANDNIIQILPNPYRQENYFQGGVVYELPDGNVDRYRLEVSPPFGKEEIILHSSTYPLGALDLTAVGNVYSVKTNSGKIGIKTRGLKMVSDDKSGDKTLSKPLGAEFIESRVELKTSK